MSDYTTSDLSLATALLCTNFPLMSLHKQDGKGYFHFDHSQDLDRFVEDYFANRTLVNPLAYSSSTRALKNYLYNQR